MEEIIRLENEHILSRLEYELTKLDIVYFVKKTDITILPGFVTDDYYAILFSDIENKDIINEIFENLKTDYNSENENNHIKYNENLIKYCSNCGFENIVSVEMCKNCGGLIFIDKKPKINNKPSIFVSILSFLLPLIGLIIASFCNNFDERRRYRNCALMGILFYTIISLINRCIDNREYRKITEQFIENIYNRERN
jgi:hypothetical protein